MQKFALLTSVITLSLSTSTLAGIVKRDLVIANANLSPDGFKRSTVVANGQFPAPLISGNLGDRFQINVIDKLTDSTMRRATSIHWHGLFQHHQNEFDGPAFVNQCPIVPNESFLYDFENPGQSGTYWYHSHLSTQYCDGLRGPLVIYDPNDPLKDMYDVDDNTTVLTLGDWYHAPAPSLFPTTTEKPGDPNDPIQKSTTVNGKGRFPGGPSDWPLSVTNVKQGLRYRFRIVAAVCGPTYNFSIDGHRMTVIEADGVETNPLPVDVFQIFPGQRYSVVVNADQPIDNYWIRVIPTGPEAGTGTNESFVGGLNAAILRYDGANYTDPTSQQNPNGVLLNEANLSPLINPGAPGQPFVGGVDRAINLNVTFIPATGRHFINGNTFVPPNTPVLLQILSGTTDPNKLLPKGSVVPLPANSTIEVSFSPGGFPHPFHLHGHNFDVVRVAGSDTYNYANPVRRDVVSIGGRGDNVTFRFVTDNPGPWFLHCHIDWHLDAGLALVFAEDIPDVKADQPVNAQWRSLCPAYAQSDPDKHFEGGLNY
ncbi:laccase [Sanghuangporus baumii]|uniref:Laccase n=1 Tax=Sanghuangporus baumii TaxID=108892 RepID=A0A9Q5I514_SANBA|nr:laccase [Sanghuangporus baumii]